MTTTYTFTGLSVNTNYTFRIRASNTLVGPASASVMVFIETEPNDPMQLEFTVSGAPLAMTFVPAGEQAVAGFYIDRSSNTVIHYTLDRETGSNGFAIDQSGSQITSAQRAPQGLAYNPGNDRFYLYNRPGLTQTSGQRISSYDHTGSDAESVSTCLLYTSDAADE